MHESREEDFYRKTKASKAMMASSEGNIDLKQSSVANPARLGRGYQVWTHPPKL